MQSFHDSQIFVIGDFNASKKNDFGPLLSDFYQDNNFFMSDDHLLPENTFTYVSDINGACSWIDHCIASPEAHKMINKMEILHNFVISDHRSIAVSVICAQFKNIRNGLCDANSNKSYNKKIRWQSIEDHKKSDVLGFH